MKASLKVADILDNGFEQTAEAGDMDMILLDALFGNWHYSQTSHF